MARLQILELPEGPGDDRPPFILVVDETMPQRIVIGVNAPWFDYWQSIADKIGALAAIVVPETVDLPGNEVPIGPDGYPLKVRIEGDFEQFHQQVEEEALAAHGKVTRALKGTGQAEKQTSDIQDEDLLTKRMNETTDALGLDRLPRWDDVHNAAAEIREAVERIRQLHRPVTYGERVICAECSGYGLGSTDNAPVDHDQCGTRRALKGPNPR